MVGSYYICKYSLCGEPCMWTEWHSISFKGQSVTLWKSRRFSMEYISWTPAA